MLTKVLKDSLIDPLAAVVLIICVSPSIDSFQETQSTLKFADRAKRVVIKPPATKLVRSNTSTNQSIDSFVNEIEKLKKENKEL